MKYLALAISLFLLINCKNNQKIQSSEADTKNQNPIEDTIVVKNTNISKSGTYSISMKNLSKYKLQIFAVKLANIDKCNTHSLNGEFKVIQNDREKIKLEYNANGIISTKMACGDQSTLLKKVYSQPYQSDYILSDTLEIKCGDGIFIEYRKLNATNQLYEAEYK